MSTKLNSQDLKKMLVEKLPAAQHHAAAKLADAIARAVNGEGASLQANTFAADIQPLLQALAGQEISSQRTLISFGQGNRLGNVNIGDVAGNNVVKLNFENVEAGATSVKINFNLQAMGQGAFSGAASQPNIYISHNAVEPDAKETLAGLQNEFAALGFDVLLDDERTIQEGEADEQEAESEETAELRRELYTTMSLAHAAVVLVSSAALDDARVHTELQYLTGRLLLAEQTSLGQEFQVVVARVPSVPAQEVKEKLVAPLRLPVEIELPQVTGETPEQIAQNAAAMLAMFRGAFLLRTRFECLEQQISANVQKADLTAVTAAAYQLGLMQPEQLPDMQRIRWVAQTLWQTDTDDWYQAIQRLVFADRNDRVKLAKLVAPAWVNPAAARWVIDTTVKSSNCRVVVVNGRLAEFTAKSFVQRAFCIAPDEPPRVIHLEKGMDETGIPGLVKRVKTKLIDRYVPGEIDPEDDEAFSAMMNGILKFGPVFVSIPPPPPKPQDLVTLLNQLALPQLKFFLLVPDAEAAALFQDLNVVLFIKPALAANEEWDARTRIAEATA